MEWHFNILYIEDAICEHLKQEKGKDKVWWSKSGFSNSSCRFFLPSDGRKFLAFNYDTFWSISLGGNLFFKKIFFVSLIVVSRATPVVVVLLQRYNSPTRVEILYSFYSTSQISFQFDKLIFFKGHIFWYFF